MLVLVGGLVGGLFFGREGGGYRGVHLGRKYGTHGTKRTVTVRFGNARYETHGGGGATVRSAVRSAVRSCATRALPCVLGGNQNARRLAPSIWRTLEMRRHLLHVIQCYKSKHSRLALTSHGDVILHPRERPAN